MPALLAVILLFSEKLLGGGRKVLLLYSMISVAKPLGTCGKGPQPALVALPRGDSCADAKADGPCVTHEKTRGTAHEQAQPTERPKARIRE